MSILTLPVNSIAEYDLRQDKRNQILNYKNDAARLSKIIDDNNNLIAQYKAEIMEFESELNLLGKFIGEIETDGIGDLDSLYLKEIEINQIRQKLDPLRDNFRKKIIWLYKYGSDYETEVLFTSRSLEDLYSRIIYLNKISGIRKKEFEKIRENRYFLEEKKKLLSLQARQRLGYIASKKDDQRTLYEKKILTENIIKKLEKENENYGRQIERINVEIRKIETRLTNLNVDFKYEIERNPDYSGTPFAQLQRRLILPVNSVDIIDDFGTYVNSNTLAVSYNNGIDVSIASGSEVIAVADGIIEDIKYIPSIGNIVIINHGDNYRTVYGVVDEIAVSVGEQIPAGKIIAFTSQNLNGQSFHFELWKDNQPQNPKFWFRRN
ncbi:MAG TPA: peptidoglycan DD-metalloendopeptidase family protein [Ignavibacteria bacterium]|nr:peptidoglycan DD-metalloendopeptidase family protein [Ignavibacteria bacterium]